MSIFMHLLSCFVCSKFMCHMVIFSSAGKESPCNTTNPSLIPRSGRFPGQGIGKPLQYSWASLVAQTVKNQHAMWEIWVQSLVWEDPLEEGMANPLQYSCVENPHGQRSLTGYHPWNCKESDTTE